MTTLIMDKPKGGRGHIAPYDTKQMRVPVGLESQIQELISRYRDWISQMGSQIARTDNPPLLLDRAGDTSNQEPVDRLLDRIDELNKLVDKLQSDCNRLASELAACKASQPQQPDLEAASDRYLASLKLGKQAPDYKKIKKALNGFIDLLRSP